MTVALAAPQLGTHRLDDPRPRRLRVAPGPVHPVADTNAGFRCDVQDVADGLAAAVASLGGRSAQVLSMRSGLDGSPPASVADIGIALGLSGERVRHVQDVALDRLATAARRPDTIDASLAALVRAWLDLPSLTELVEELDLGGRDGADRDLAVELVLALAGVDGRRRARCLAELEEWRARQLDGPTVTTGRPDCDALVDEWFRRARWSSDATPFDDGPAVPPPVPVMTTRTGTTGPGGFESAKLGRTVGFGTQLELDVLLRVERSPLVARYRHRPVAVEHDRHPQHPPRHGAVVLEHVDGRILLAEIGPAASFATSTARTRSSDVRGAATANGWGWVQLGVGGRVVDLHAHPIDARVRHALDAVLARTGAIRWRDVLAARSAVPMTSGDVAAYATQGGLRLTARPYRLTA